MITNEFPGSKWKLTLRSMVIGAEEVGYSFERAVTVSPVDGMWAGVSMTVF